MAAWMVFKPRFYSCLMRGIKAEIVPKTRARGWIGLAFYLVLHMTFIFISVCAFTDVLDFSRPHYLEDETKVPLQVVSVLLWLLSLCVHLNILVLSCKRATAEMEGRPYEPDQRTSVSRQQLPQVESGVDLSGRRDRRERCDRDRRPSSFWDSAMRDTLSASWLRVQPERLRITEEPNENSPSGEELELDVNAPIIEEPESDESAPGVEHNLDDHSPIVEECELVDYPPSTEQGVMNDLLEQIKHRSRHPSKSDEQSSSASHATQAAAVYETNSEETAL